MATMTIPARPVAVRFRFSLLALLIFIDSDRNSAGVVGAAESRGRHAHLFKSIMPPSQFWELPAVPRRDDREFEIVQKYAACTA